MAETTTITIRVSKATKQGLDRLADLTKRSRSYLAAEALEQYLAEELDIVEGIQRGLDDVAAGRTVPHEQVMAELKAIVAKARKKQRKVA